MFMSVQITKVLKIENWIKRHQIIIFGICLQTIKNKKVTFIILIKFKSNVILVAIESFGTQ